MAYRRVSESEKPHSRRRPAETPDLRELQLVNLAFDLAERQLSEGTASAQVISHFLKARSPREMLEQERIRHENELMEVKRKAIADQANLAELFENAMAAMRSYTGKQSED